MGMIDRDDAIQAICEACYMYKYIGEHYKDCKYYPCDDVTALESVSEAPKPTGDLISRADAIEAVTDIQDGSGQRYYLAVSLVDKIRSLPSAEAVQGEWIDIDNYYRLATCSHCHKVTMFEKWGEYTRTYNFCHNCGARMVNDET